MSDELAEALPNCASCLRPLDVGGDDPERPYWVCPTCGTAAIAVAVEESP